MAEGMIGWLTQRLGGWVEEAERRGRPQARRAVQDGRATLEDLRALWERIEDLVDRDVAPRAARYAGQAGEAASDTARWAGERAHDGIRDAMDRYGPRAHALAGDALAQARDAARARPVAAIAIAVAGTWLLTTLLRSGRR